MDSPSVTKTVTVDTASQATAIAVLVREEWEPLRVTNLKTTPEGAFEVRLEGDKSELDRFTAEIPTILAAVTALEALFTPDMTLGAFR